MIERENLKKNWNLKIGSPALLPEHINFPVMGIPVEVPGTVHTDLLSQKLIGDPFYSDNELKLTWIENQTWIYENVFDYPEKFSREFPVYLIFEGIDTVAEIELNDKKIGSVSNMFRLYEFNVTDRLKSKTNTLRILIKPPRKAARKQSKPIRQLPSARHRERVFLRKAQYSFGWDWGPAFPTSGIWRPVYICQREKNWIKSVSFDTLSLTNDQATVQVLVKVRNKKDPNHIKAILEHGGQIFETVKSIQKNKVAKIKWKIPKPLLWWPNGMGKAHLLNLTISLLSKDGRVMEHQSREVAIRKIDLVLKNKAKNTFRFKVNGKSIFVKGANWIPADSFLPRVREEVYDYLLHQAKDAHMNMIRVWGGGIYENDVFYQLCDELGLMVWQDFMFACAAYPQDDKFVDEVKAEITQNVARLRIHPCLALWCGNNENEWIWYRDNCGKINKMPGFSLFHKIIPDLLKKIDPGRPYWPTTPFSYEDDPNDVRSGNRHAWDIWGRWVDYTDVVHDHSHFVTEFGFQGPANYHTMNKVIPDKEMQPHSALFEFHNKQEEGAERLTKFLAAHLPLRTDIKSYVYLTQINQGLALKTCLDYWRQNWPETNGSIIWQLNDCWPVSSWSLIDSDNKPKPAYYFVKRSFAPVSLIFCTSHKGISLKISKHQIQQIEGKFQSERFFNGNRAGG